MKRTSNNKKSIPNKKQKYIQGNVLTKEELQEMMFHSSGKKKNPITQKNREKMKHMNPGYVLFLMGALFIMGYALLSYLDAYSELTNKINNISKLEYEYNLLKDENNENYYRIENSINLEQIKKIAIGELGMIYPREEQIIYYEPVEIDYMRKVIKD